MTDLDLQRLIASHRSRLNEEKERLHVQQKSSRTDNVKDRSRAGGVTRQGNPATSAKQSVAETRRELSQQRDREIAELDRNADRRFEPTSEPDDRDPYFELKERRLAEERRYHQLPAEQEPHKPRKQWDNDSWVQPNALRPPHGFHPGPGTGQPTGNAAARRWEEDDSRLVEWAKGRSHSARRDHPDPPTAPPSQKAPKEPKGGTRSISAPIVTGIAAIGEKESVAKKRSRQRQYAEELKAQMRVKALAKEREKGELLSDVTNAEGVPLKERQPLQREESDRPLRREESDRLRREGSNRLLKRQKSPSLHHSDHSEDYRWMEERGTNKPPHGRWSPPPPPPHGHPDQPPRGRWSPPPPPPYGHPDQPPRGRWSPPPPHDHHDHRHHPHSPPDPFYPGPHYHYSDPLYPYPPQYPPYAYGPKHSPYAPPPWPLPFYPPVLPHGYGPTLYYPPPFPTDGHDAQHSHQSLEGKGDSRMREAQKGGRGSGAFSPPPPNRDPKKAKEVYRLMLREQMEEKKEKEGQDKARVAEAAEYNPWGKGGGGAPMRDEHGRLVADLRKMRLANNEKLLRTSLQTSPHGAEAPAAPIASSDKLGMTMTVTPAEGGTGVEGVASREGEQQVQGTEDYRESLRRQMEEREALRRREKEAKKEEDLRELERIKCEQQKIAEDYRREQELTRKKELDARMRNALLKKEAEEKRVTEASRKLGAAGDRVQFAADGQASAQLTLDDASGGNQLYRGSSPPVPALKHMLSQQKGGFQPPLPPSPHLQTSLPTSPQQVYLQSQPSHHASSQIQKALTPSPIQRMPSPPVPALRKKLQAAPNPVALNPAVPNPAEPLSSQTENVPKHQQPKLPGPTQTTVQGSRPPPDFQAPKPQQDSAKLLRELSAIKKHLQSEQAKLAAKMVPIHRTEGTGPHVPTAPLLQSEVNRQPPGNQQLLTFQPPIQHPFSFQPSTHHTTMNNSQFQMSGGEAANSRAAAAGMNQEPKGPLLASESEQFPFNEQVSADPPTKPRTRTQWEIPKPPYPSNLSRTQSVMTFDLDAIAAQNEERQRRLEAILNAGAPRDPQTVLKEFLNRTTKLQPNQKLPSQ